MCLWKKTLKELLFAIYVSSAVNSSLLPHLTSFRNVLTVEEKYILMNSGHLQFKLFLMKNNRIDTTLGST